VRGLTTDYGRAITYEQEDEQRRGGGRGEIYLASRTAGHPLRGRPPPGRAPAAPPHARHHCHPLRLRLLAVRANLGEEERRGLGIG
jgi:hypothetical protein